MNVDITSGERFWIEQDNVFGLTDGDKEIVKGDLVEVNVRVQFGDCKEW